MAVRKGQQLLGDEQMAHLEILVAFRPAEMEDGGVIAYERNAVSRVDAATAEPAFFYSHLAAPL